MEKAKKSSKEIIEEQRSSALLNAKKVVDSIMMKANDDANIIREKISTDIRNQAGWIVLAEKERLITEVMNEVKNKLKDMQKSQEYPKVLEKLIIKGGMVLGGGVLKVLINKNDSKLCNYDKLSKEISKKTGVKTKINLSKNYITDIGVKIKTSDNKIYVDNTFEEIIRRKEKIFRLKIAKILFKDLN
jgi:vacuolar-type H+-ATPase subunit E/Vma4